VFPDSRSSIEVEGAKELSVFGCYEVSGHDNRSTVCQEFGKCIAEECLLIFIELAEMKFDHTGQHLVQYPELEIVSVLRGANDLVKLRPLAVTSVDKVVKLFLCTFKLLCCARCVLLWVLQYLEEGLDLGETQL